MAESTDPTNQFLQIQRKEDTAAKLMAVAGLPRKNYVFAPEINKMVAAINLLRTLIAASPGQIEEIIATGVKLDLGEIATNVITVLNAAAPGNSLGEAGTTFIVYTIDGVQYVDVFAGEPGVYGYFTNVTPEMIIPLYDGSASVARKYYEFDCTITQDEQGIWVKAFNDEFTDKQLTVLVTPIDAGGVMVAVYQPSENYNFAFMAVPEQRAAGAFAQIYLRQANARQLFIETSIAGEQTPNLLSGFPLTIKAYRRTNEYYQQPEII